jgi:5,5'-dehydrodivanillate O-demethylase oxygenase subunit
VPSEEENVILTRVGRGTPMGELLRRYWHPVAPVLELRHPRVKPVRLLGEDLVLFAKPAGGYGLIARTCPHRGTDLSHGWVDEEQLRCPYHGWAFDDRGSCTEQPFEQADGSPGFRDTVRLDAYPTASVGGLIWAYLGPDPAPLLPDFEPYSWTHGFAEIILTELPCNWFQCHENSVDPVHFEWLHTNWTAAQQAPDAPRYGARHLSADFVEFEFGFVCLREVDEGRVVVRPTSHSHSLAEGGMLCMWPHTLVTGKTIEWRVPMDDTHTLHITRQYSTLPDDAPPVHQEPDAIPYWYGPLTDPATGRLLTSHMLNREFAAWIGQGTVADRTKERLGRSDAGITLLRQRFLEEIDRVADGKDPAGTVRDHGQNSRIPLPVYRKSWYVDGMSREAYEQLLGRHRKSALAGDGYPSVQAGRPEHIRRMYRDLPGTI